MALLMKSWLCTYENLSFISSTQVKQSGVEVYTWIQAVESGNGSTPEAHRPVSLALLENSRSVGDWQYFKKQGELYLRNSTWVWPLASTCMCTHVCTQMSRWVHVQRGKEKMFRVKILWCWGFVLFVFLIYLEQFCEGWNFI